MGMLDVHEDKIGSFLSRKVCFNVPVYQRPIAWTGKEWDDIFQDVKNLGNEDIHFIGPLVLVSENKYDDSGIEYFQVIDGQQRLTTILIWLSAIRDLAKDEKDDGLVQHIEGYLFSENYQNNKIVKIPKLILGKLDHDAFLEVLNNGNKDYDHLIFDCYNYFKSKVNSKDWTPILNNIHVVSINTPNFLNAFRLFETMNDRGLALSSVDLIKNYIFMKVADNSKILQDTIIEWNNMYNKVSFDPDRFLRHYFMSNFRGKITEKLLYPEMRKKLDKIEGYEILDFVKNLNAVASIYKKLHENSFDSEDINYKLENLKYVGNSSKLYIINISF